MPKYIHDKELNEYYVPEQLQCEKCSNEAVIDGLCEDCYGDEKEIKP
jgi:hypothetical protein